MEFLKVHQFGLMQFMEGICAIIAFLVLLTNNISRSRKCALFFLEISALLLMACTRITVGFRGVTGGISWIGIRVTQFGTYFFGITILVAFNFYMIDLLKNEGGLKHTPLTLKLINITQIIATVLVFVSLFTGLYYTIDENNNYIRSPGRIVSYVFPFISMVLLLVCIIFNYKRLPKKLRLPLIMFTVVPLGATVLQAIFKGVYLSYLTVVGMAIVLYVFALDEMNNAIERAHRLEVEMLEKYQKELEKTVDERTHERILFVNR